MISRRHRAGRLIVFSGLLGTGKSSIARPLAEATGGLWLRIAGNLSVSGRYDEDAQAEM